MTLPALDNLVRIGQLKAEPRNDVEARRMLTMACTRLADAQLGNLSAEGRAYNATHAAAKTATPFSNACPTRWVGPPFNGAFWITPTRNGISPNTKGFWRLKNPPSQNFACC